MLWILFLLTIPVVDAFGNLFSKKAALSRIDPLLISWCNNILTFLLAFPSVFFVKYTFSPVYFEALAVSGSLNIVGTILMMKAISMGDISKIIPMLSFTPLFMLITSPLVVGEFPKVGGIIGIVLIVSGSYLLNIDVRKRDLLSPLKELIKNPGTRIMLFVSFLFSFTSTFDKVAIRNCYSPLQHIFFLNLYIFTGISAIVLILKRLNLQEIKKQKNSLIMVSIMNAAGNFLFATSILYTFVAYIIAIKRSSGMLSVIIGHFYFKEPNVRERIFGSAIMFLGVIFIIFS